MSSSATKPGFAPIHARLALCAMLCTVWSSAQAAQWSADLTVTHVFTEGTTDTIGVYTQGGTAYVTGCAVNAWAVVSNSDARRARAYSTIVAAMASGKKVRFFYADSCGELGYHAAIAVMLVD